MWELVAALGSMLAAEVNAWLARGENQVAVQGGRQLQKVQVPGLFEAVQPVSAQSAAWLEWLQ